MARVTVERAREIIRSWADQHNLTQTEVLNLALIDRKVMIPRYFDGRYAYLERLYVVIGHKEFKLTVEERELLEEKQAASGINYALRRQIAEFLVSRWRKTGELPPDEFARNLPGDKKNSVDEVIRRIRHSKEFKEFVESLEVVSEHVVQNGQSEADSQLKEVALHQIHATVALLQHLCEEEPSVVESFADSFLVRQFAQMGNILTSGKPIQTYKYFLENEGRSLAPPK